jgi:Na+-translocating ferredoxin:NAD+ oxidoreductase RnfG subunit
MSWNPGPWVALPVVVVSSAAYATTFFTTEQAQQAIFPGKRLSAAFVTLSEAQAKAIEKASGVDVRNREVHAWKVEGGGWFVLDEVVGKHEFITYAVGIDASGAVKDIEIVDYRETYGYQVRDPEWRKQFVGKTAADPLRLTHDIRNVSGATLSCKHVADGVKRVLATYDVALK